MATPNVKFNIQTKRFRNNLDRFGDSLEDVTAVVAQLALEKAQELERPHIDTGALYNSLRLEKKETAKADSYDLKMGGLGTTINNKGVDYAAYHEEGTSVTPPARILQGTLDWIRQEGLDEAVQLSLRRVNLK